MWKNVVESDRPEITICCMRIACWIPKVTNTNSKYVIVNDFPPQERLHERASMLRYRSTHTAFFDSVYAVYKRSKQARQYAYNVIFWSVHVTTVEKKQLCIVCVLLHLTLKSTEVLSLHKSTFKENLCCRQKQNIKRSLCGGPHIFSDFKIILSSLTDFHKILQYKFSRNPSIRSGDGTCIQTDLRR
jgi:hypothetical protein